MSDEQIGNKECIEAFIDNSRTVNPDIWISMDGSSIKLVDLECMVMQKQECKV